MCRRVRRSGVCLPVLVLSLVLCPPPALSQGHVTTLGFGGGLLQAISSVAADGSHAVAGVLFAPQLQLSQAGVVIKLSASGTVLWRKLIGSGSEAFSGIALLPDGGFAVVGTTSSSAAGSTDAWVVRLDAGGGIVWQRSYGGPGPDGASSVVVLADGDLGVIGSTRSFGAGESDLWLLRLDGAGNVVWQRSYGDAGDEVGAGGAATADGGLIAVATRPRTSSGSGESGPLVLRVDPGGAPVWQSRLEAPGSPRVSSVVSTPADGGVLLGAPSLGGVWLVKLDAGGQGQWQKVIAADPPPIDVRLAVAEDGTYLAAVDRGVVGKLTLVRLDTLGTPLNQEQFPLHTALLGVRPEWGPLAGMSSVPGGGVVIAGTGQSVGKFGTRITDGWLSTLDAHGTSACGGQSPGTLTVSEVTTTNSVADVASLPTAATASVTTAPISEAPVGAGRACPGPPTASTVAVIVANGGSGTVTSQPPGSDCGPTCHALFAPDLTITFTATPIPGGAVVRWHGCEGEGASCTLPTAGALRFVVGAEFTSPMDRLADVVRDFFVVVLGRRDPSEADMIRWLDPLLRDPTPRTVALMAHAFFDGAEYRTQHVTLAGYVRALYETLLGRNPGGGRKCWVGPPTCVACSTRCSSPWRVRPSSASCCRTRTIDLPSRPSSRGSGST